jgi:hypothetical protein
MPVSTPTAAGPLNANHATGASLRRSRLLLGDWNPIIRDPIDLIRLGFLVGAIVALVLGDIAADVRAGLGERPRRF